MPDEPTDPQGAAPSDAAVAVEIDATGLSCPMPVIELARAMGGIAVGQTIRLIATDPAATVDVPVWCRMQRHHLRAQDRRDGAWHFLVERAR